MLFVSHLPLQPSGGGVYAVTWKIAEILREHFRLQPFTPVVPRVNRRTAAWSKLRRRVLRRPGTFYQFSEQTLLKTASEVAQQIRPETEAVFFRSATRWIRCQPQIPYFVHTDVVFHTFFHNTFHPDDFIRRDLQRIWDAEKQFLENATGVFFESDWGRQKAIEAYSLQGNHFHALRNGGLIDPPAADTWSGQTRNLVTIAKNFRQKGGDLALQAFQQLKPHYPDLNWHIIGGPPEGDWASMDGVFYEGFLRPDVPEELQRFRRVLSNSFLLIHPTREDTNPLVLVEAASFGCPAVSVEDFAIPELVVDGETGVLLSRPVSSSDVANVIEQLLNDPVGYQKMRSAARSRAVSRFDWDAIGQEMATLIRRCLAEKPV